MKYLSMLFLCFSLAGIASMNLYAELLIVKKTETGFEPLGAKDTEKIQKDLAEVLLSYQWPMCIGSQLTASEQTALLSPGKPRAEELFVEKKLREKTGDNTLGVVFIPTALYELFVITEIFRTRGSSNGLQKTVLEFLDEGFNPIPEARRYDIHLQAIINSKDSAAEIRKNIGFVYDISNVLFYKKGQSKSAHSYINGQLGWDLLSRYPELKQSENASLLSDALEKKALGELALLLERFLSFYKQSNPEALYLQDSRTDQRAIMCANKLAERLIQEKTNKIVAKTIALEYEAREMNKGILFRGSSFIEIQVGGIAEDAKKKIVAGSTLNSHESIWERNKESGRFEQRNMSFEEAYKTKNNNLYSISFGNSLFAGCLKDCEACAYSFLYGARVGKETSRSILKATGYALFIDKKEYVVTNNANLFFIASLSPLAALLQRGEFFHSRAKAAIAKKIPIGSSIWGLMSGLFTDPTGVMLITRDPLKHAALFSQFLVDNGRIIQTGNESDLSPEERKFVEDVKSAHVEASKFYKAIQFITPKIEKIVAKTKATVKAKNKENGIKDPVEAEKPVSHITQDQALKEINTLFSSAVHPDERESKIRALFKECASNNSPLDPNQSMGRKRGITILQKAVMYGPATLVDFLLKEGGIPSKKNNDGENSFHMITQYEEDLTDKEIEDISKLLLAKEVNAPGLNALDNQGYTPLFHAIHHNRTFLQKIFREHGAQEGVSVSAAAGAEKH